MALITTSLYNENDNIIIDQKRLHAALFQKHTYVYCIPVVHTEMAHMVKTLLDGNLYPFNLAHQYMALPIFHVIFSSKNSEKRPNSSTIRARYGVSFVGSLAEQSCSFLRFVLLLITITKFSLLSNGPLGTNFNEL